MGSRPVGRVGMSRYWRRRWMDLRRHIPVEAIRGDVSNSQRTVTYHSPPVERREASPVAMQAIECQQFLQFVGLRSPALEWQAVGGPLCRNDSFAQTRASGAQRLRQGFDVALTATKAATTSGSNCVPLFARMTSTAFSCGTWWYVRETTRASYTSTTCASALAMARRIPRADVIVTRTCSDSRPAARTPLAGGELSKTSGRQLHATWQRCQPARNL